MTTSSSECENEQNFPYSQFDKESGKKEQNLVL